MQQALQELKQPLILQSKYEELFDIDLKLLHSFKSPPTLI